MPGRVRVEVRRRVPLQQPDDRLGDNAAAHLPEMIASTLDLRLPQDVEPERRLLHEAAGRELRKPRVIQLVRRELLDVERVRGRLARREAQYIAPQQGALGQLAQQPPEGVVRSLPEVVRQV